MGERTAGLRLCRAPAFIVIVLLALLLPAGVALAADGVPLYPPGVDSAYSLTSMENPDMSGPALTFELFGLSNDAAHTKSSVARVMFWNAATGVNRPIGSEVPGLLPTDDQRHPSVLDASGDVYVVWQQGIAGLDSDIWLWRGDEQGTTAAGYPMLLVRGAAIIPQTSPDIGLMATPNGNHIVVAWEDSHSMFKNVWALDLSADTDGDGTPDYLEAAFDPSLAGQQLDPNAADQHDPVVGAKGIFWLDDRRAGGSLESDVYRADLSGAAPVVGVFWLNEGLRQAVVPRATNKGVAWLGPGIAGGPFEPWVKDVGGGTGIATFLANPTALDACGARLAVIGGHGGNTDGDGDVFFFDRATKQNVPVCSVGEAPMNRLKVQDMPTIGTAPGGSRVVWADTRQWTNTAATDWSALAYELYVALVPTVSENASKTTVKAGHAITLKTRVTPNFKGYRVSFQKGKRTVFTHPDVFGGKSVTYTKWKTLKTVVLSKKSAASWTWKPSAKGTYWIRAWFKGGKKYADVGGRKVPHVGNASKVIRIIVK